MGAAPEDPDSWNQESSEDEEEQEELEGMSEPMEEEAAELNMMPTRAAGWLGVQAYWERKTWHLGSVRAYKAAFAC